MKDLSWVNHPAMKNMDARKMKVIVTLLNEVEGQSIEASLPAIMRANQDLKQMGLSFTPQEMTVLMDLITKDMTPAQKQKVEMLKTMMNFQRR